MKVLVVEDDASLREGISDVLAELAEVRSAGSVDAALALLQQERFELVLTDLRLAGMGKGGRAILEAARQRLQAVAIVSAASQEDLHRVLHPLEADAILTKPFQLEDMIALVERFLALRGDLERLAKARPPESGWTEAGTGVHLQQVQAPAPEQDPTWLRLQPGTSYAWAHHQGRAGVLVVEGALEVEGERQSPPRYLFLSTSQPPSVKTEQGCLAISLALRG